uniref:Uncharacterized protein n=1 Tax=Anopheles culicifacies TaxID=139723 RepID=A0A182M6P6_9DIPT
MVFSQALHQNYESAAMKSNTREILIESAPQRLEAAYKEIFTEEALEFLAHLVSKFDAEVEQLLQNRVKRKLLIQEGEWKPEFNNYSESIEWTIDALPDRLRNRKLDLGDVSPANTVHFTDCLYANVQGIQVDFDDGHCPNWRNTVQGLFNVTRAVHGKLQGAPADVQAYPLLMLRPRAFNMIEHHCIVNGKEVVGPLFDFAMLISDEEIIESVKMAKSVEIDTGVDGFMIYDLRMVDAINHLWESKLHSENHLNMLPNISHITADSLLQIPKGGVTIDGLNNNITVALLFIYHWLTGSGVFFLNGSVEDSATAEISRSQLWQWIRMGAVIEDRENIIVTRTLVYQMMDKIISAAYRAWCITPPDRKRLLSAKYMLLDVISSRDYIEYITTHLNDSHKFRTLHNKNDGLMAKL